MKVANIPSAIPALLGALGLAAGPALAAGGKAGEPYVKGMASYIFADSDRLVDDELAGGLVGFGWAVDERWNLELDVQSLSLSGEQGGPDQRQTALSANAMYVWARDARFSPYALAGLGILNTDIKGERDRDNLHLQGGLGLLAGLSDRLALRGEVLYRRESASGSPGDVLLNLGLQLAIGSRQPAPAPVPAQPQPAPAAATPPPPPPPPPPPAPEPVPDVIELPNVKFAFDSDRLLEDGREALDDAAALLRRNPTLVVEPQGHTDSDGSATYNQALSERRAAAVREYLIGQGVPAAQLAPARGYGESRPIADNTTAEGKARNRRVELQVIAR